MQVYGLDSPSHNGIWPEKKLKTIYQSSLELPIASKYVLLVILHRIYGLKKVILLKHQQSIVVSKSC